MAAAGVAVLKHHAGYTITIRDVSATATTASVTAYHGTGDQLGAVDNKTERNHAGILVSEVSFEIEPGDEVVDENSETCVVLKARKTNHGTWELQTWRPEKIF